MPKYETLPLPFDDDDQNAAKPEGKPAVAVEQWAASKIATIGAPRPKGKRGKRIRRPVMPDTLPKGESDKSEV